MRAVIGMVLLAIALTSCGGTPAPTTNEANLQGTIAALTTAVAQGQAGPTQQQAVQPTQASNPTTAATAVGATSAPTALPATPTAAPSATQAPSPTTAPSPTPELKAGDTIYEANWKDDNDGWSGTADWRVLTNMLINTGKTGGGSTSVASVIFAPISLEKHPDYAVEATIQVIRAEQAYGGNKYGLIGRWTGNKGYWAGVAVWCNGAHNAILVADTQNPECVHGALAAAPFSLDTKEHTLRLELQGNNVRLIIDGATLIDQKDNTFLDPGKVGVWSTNMQMEVHSFKVIKL